MGTKLGLSHYWDIIDGWHLKTVQRIKQGEVTTIGRRKFHNEELHNEHSWPNTVRIMTNIQNLMAAYQYLS
jgi:hypothetical protein